MSRRILLTGGGTAGSFTPLLAVVERLRHQDPSISFLFVGTKLGPEQGLADAAGIEFRTIPAGKWRRYWAWKNFSDIKNFWAGFRAAQRIIQAWKPDTILSAGAYVSVPVVWAGHLAGCKVLIHQQDVQPGLANRLMTPAADRISVTFPQSVKAFPAKKVILTGNPVRPDILAGTLMQARAIFHLKEHVPILLILGGSTGSQFLNNMVGATAYRLVTHWQIIHLTGSHRDFIELNDEHYHRYDFLTWELAHAIAAADVVITRVGLGTLSELAALSKACIFVPMPRTHQEQNAKLLADLKAGIVLNQDQLDPPALLAMTERLRKNPAERKVFGENLHQLYRPDAAERLTEVVLGLVKS